jgi:cellulose biosynthesis protein BcsQ
MTEDTIYFSFVNPKGGTCKTTSCVSIGGSVILETKVPNLHIAPSEPDLDVAEVLMQNRRNKSFILRQMILDIYNNKCIKISPPPHRDTGYI